MFPDITAKSIKAALSNNWLEAIELNLIILKENPDDIEALNRLARAFKESGKFKEAQKTYRRVLTLDRFNSIATKNLMLLEAIPKCPNQQTVNYHHYLPRTYLEEPGKTKVVNLINLAPLSSLLLFSCGDQINLVVKRRSLNVVDTNGTYLGALPDDLSIKLIKRISGGNQYEAHIKTVSKNCLSIFIREIFRSAKFKNQPTFPGAGGENYVSIRDNIEPNEELELNEEALVSEPVNDDNLTAA